MVEIHLKQQTIFSNNTVEENVDWNSDLDTENYCMCEHWWACFIKQ